MATKRSDIPETTQRMLWGIAAGRCQFTGCNKPVWRTSTTKETVNIADVSHIIAFSERGPRGHKKFSKKLAKELSNLMLLCDECHTLIDKNEKNYPVERLRQMKQDHERRIETVVGITPEKQSEILLYGANIGHHSSHISYEKAAKAILPDWYPANIHPISLGMKNSSWRDFDKKFWRIESEHLCSVYNEQIKPRLNQGTIGHLSIFAFAPQPLLMLLGSLLSDIPAGEVYQLHREPPDWRWQDHPQNFEYKITEPREITGPPALVLSLSATIKNDRITDVLGNDVSIWSITISQPHNDFLKSQDQLRLFRQTMRPLMDRIKARHGENALLHVFPAVPVSIAVEIGRIIMPKADLSLRIYDQNNKRFIPALDLEIAASQRKL